MRYWLSLMIWGGGWWRLALQSRWSPVVVRRLLAVEQWEGVVYQEKHSGSDDTTGSAAMGRGGGGGWALRRWSAAAKRLFTVAPCWSVAHRSNLAVARRRFAVG